MPKLVLVTDREREAFLHEIIPSLVHVEKFREDSWEIVVRESNEVLISINIDIKSIKEWYQTEGVPWQLES